MLVVLSPNADYPNNDNMRDFLATFTSPLELSPHSRVSLISAQIPMNFRKIYNTDPTATNFTGNVFTVNSLLQSTTLPNSSVSQIYTVPANQYDLYGLINAMNQIIVNTNKPVNFSTHNNFYFSYDVDTNCVIFNVVMDGNQQAIDYAITLEDAVIPPTQSLLHNLGFCSNSNLNKFISIIGSGLASFPNPPLSVTQFFGQNINIALPSLNISSIQSNFGIKNTTSIIHSIPFDINNIRYNASCQNTNNLATTFPMGLNSYLIYEPTHKEETEINNDGNLIINSIRVQLLDDFGNFSPIVDDTATAQNLGATTPKTPFVTIVLNIETEKEKQNDILRKVKDDKLYEKYSRNFVNYNP